MRRLPLIFIYALIFSAIFLAHAPLLRLPYYWDEAGYYIPAAHDLFQAGTLVPQSVPSNAHPPLVMLWLAAWWKLSGFTPAVTRTAMLLLSALALLAVYRLGRFAMNPGVAVAATACTALYPVFFAQSSMAHVDMAAAAFGMWGVLYFIEERRILSLAAFSLAVLAKETAVIVPAALALWELGWWLAQRAGRPRSAIAPRPRPLWELVSLLIVPAAVLAAWFAYHYHRTGFVFGNPEFFRYNVTGALHPIRILLACLRRLWQVTGYMNLFVLTVAAGLAMMFPPRLETGSSAERPRILPHIQATFAIVILVHVVALSVISGAILARYMLMAVPKVVILCVSTLRRRVRWWPTVIAIACAGFVVGLFNNPPYRFSMEDNLAYRDYILLHKAGAGLLASRYPSSRVLTAWPASDEVSKPYLGYVRSALPVFPIEDFSLPRIEQAAHDRSAYDVAYVFSTKYEPRSQSGLLRWWEKMQEGYFDYHRDLPPELIARALGGRIVWQQERNRQWAAVIALENAENAKQGGPPLVLGFNPGASGFRLAGRPGGPQ